MVNVFFFGLNVLLIYAAWSHVLKPSLIDYFRGRLVEAGGGIACYYTDNKIPLSGASYKNTQALVNSYLAFTENMSLVKVAVFIFKLENNPLLRDLAVKQIEQDFWVDGTGLEDFIKQSRKCLARTAVCCLASSSPPMFAVLACVFMMLPAASSIGHFKRTGTGGIAMRLEGMAKWMEVYSVAQFGENYVGVH